MFVIELNNLFVVSDRLPNPILSLVYESHVVVGLLESRFDFDRSLVILTGFSVL